MESKEILLMDMISLVYEDMDIEAIEERFVDLVSEIFSFDSVGLFLSNIAKKSCKEKFTEDLNRELSVLSKYQFLKISLSHGHL